MKAATPPQGLFRGSNFMTPEVIGFFTNAAPRGGRRAIYAELSTGRGMSNQPIWGVTLRYGSGERHPASRLCNSRREADELLAEVLS